MLLPSFMTPSERSRKLELSINVSMPALAGPDGLIDARAACALLGVKPASLYAYVSRGLIRSLRVGHARQRLYVGDDVRRLATRAAARRGHGAVAAGALRWGEPVLESAITSVEGGVLAYRGRPVDALLGAGWSFEQVAELLWQATSAPWRPPPRARPPRTVDDGSPVRRMIAALPAIAARDPRPWITSGAAEHDRARALIYALADAAGARFLPGPTSGRGADSMARSIARGLGRDDAVAPVIEAALIASADHELNASTFAARVAASAGAELYAAVGAALYTFTGPRHGGAPELVEGFLDELPARGLRAALRARLARGDGLPGFGHRLYPDGDPRVRAIVERLPPPRTARAARRLALAQEVAALGAELTGEHPSLDHALVMVARALDVAPAWAPALFGLGRLAGWIAHTLEQRASAALLRPRARYTGPPISGAGDGRG